MKIPFDQDLMRPGYQVANGSTVHTLIAIEPYTRKLDGKPSQLARWQHACPDCQKSRDILTCLKYGDLPQRCRDCFQKRKAQASRTAKS